MSQLLSAEKLDQSFGGRTLFTGVGLGIFEKDRIGLVGPNGAGKSTLLRILCGEQKPEAGNVVYRKGLKIGYLEQIPKFKQGSNILDTILEKSSDPNEDLARAYEVISRLNLTEFPEDTPIDKLSGGWKKRVALGRELLLNPDLLFLDEPTNHLDVESIIWLEDFIQKASFASVVITHDRLFLQRVSNKIFDLDPQNPSFLISHTGDYAQYIEAKEALLASEKAREQHMKNTYRRELEWLRRGPQARLTKQKARIDRAYDLADDLSDLKQRNTRRELKLDFESHEKSPKKLIEVTGLSKSYDNQNLFLDFSQLITPKTRLGLLGPNGCGKSTLIKCLLGIESPDSGSLKLADKLDFNYFEQNKDTLNYNLSVYKNICPEGDYVQHRGQFIHARGYLERFLFSPQQMDLPVHRLSGGEQSRLRIAQMMQKTAQVLILDEPTNDLDYQTLLVLEQALADYDGAVIIVTHDRYFLDQVATEIIAFSDLGKLERFSGYHQWETWYQQNTRPQNSAKKKGPDQRQTSESEPAKKTKLSFKEKFEFENIEINIEKAESELALLQKELSTSEVMSNHVRLTEINKKIGELQSSIDHLYSRWSELEKKAKG